MSVFLIVSYDIGDDGRRVRIASELENFGQRVQKSVFECHLEAGQVIELKDRLAALIDPARDRLRYYSLCPKDRDAVLLDGMGTQSRDPDYHIL